MKKGLRFFQDYSGIFLLIILGISVVLRLIDFNRSLWFDEVVYGTHITLKNFSSLIGATLYDTPAPFYRVFMFLWIRIFGDSEISVRIPSLVCGVLSIFLVYLIVSKFAEKKTALLTCLLLCLSPVHIWYSREAVPYSLFSFFVLMTIFTYDKLKRPDTKPIWYVFYFGSLFLAVFTHYIGSIYLIIFLIFSIFKINEVKRKMLILNLLILACFILFLILKIKFGVVRTWLGYLRPFTFFELWMLFFNWFLFGNSIWNVNPYSVQLTKVLQNPAMVCSQIFFLIIFIRGLMLYFRNSNDPRRIEVIFYLFSGPLIMLLLPLFGFKYSYIERFLFIALPFFYMILPEGALGFKSKFTRAICAGIVILFSIAALVGFFRNADVWTVYKHNPDWRSAADYFCGEIKSTEKPIFIFVTTPATALTYYYERLKRRCQNKEITVTQLQTHQARDLENIYTSLSVNNIKVFYLIKNKFWIGDFDNLLKNVTADPKFKFINNRSFKGIEIFEFTLIK